MSEKSFLRNVFIVFCVVVVIIPFAANYFRITNLDASAVDWIQMISGTGALIVALWTFTLVQAQLKKANAQLIKAETKIKLANKQLELADAQLLLAGRDSAMLTLQLRAAAFATVETEIAIMEKVLDLLNQVRSVPFGEHFFNMRLADGRPNEEFYYARQIQQASQKLSPELEMLRERITRNVEPAIAHLSGILYEDREEFMHEFHMLSLHIRSLCSEKLEQHSPEYLENATRTAANYYNVIICIGEA